MDRTDWLNSLQPGDEVACGTPVGRVYIEVWPVSPIYHRHLIMPVTEELRGEAEKNKLVKRIHAYLHGARGYPKRPSELGLSLDQLRRIVAILEEKNDPPATLGQFVASRAQSRVDDTPVRWSNGPGYDNRDESRLVDAMAGRGTMASKLTPAMLRMLTEASAGPRMRLYDRSEFETADELRRRGFVQYVEPAYIMVLPAGRAALAELDKETSK